MLPSINDNEFDLLKKITINTAAAGVPAQAVPVLSLIGGAVDVYANLPVSLGVAPVDTVYLVKHSTGIWPITDSKSGFYIRRGSSGALADWEEL